jgi:hypothetical protein
MMAERWQRIENPSNQSNGKNRSIPEASGEVFP